MACITLVIAGGGLATEHPAERPNERGYPELAGTDCQILRQEHIAVRACSDLIARYPDWAAPYAVRAFMTSNLLRSDAARADAEEALKIEPENPSALAVLAETSFHLNDKKRLEFAIARLTRLVPSNFEEYLARGVAHFFSRQQEDAMADFEQAIALSPSNPRGYAARSRVWHARQEFERFLSDIGKAIELAPDLARYYLIRGDALSKHGNFERALADCTKAITLAPEMARAFEVRGRVYELQQQNPQALLDFDAAVQLDPEFARGHAGRGRVLSAQSKNESAVEAFSRAISLDPVNLDNFIGRGEALLSLEQYSRARGDFARVLKVERLNERAAKGQLIAQSLEQEQRELSATAPSIHLPNLQDLEPRPGGFPESLSEQSPAGTPPSAFFPGTSAAQRPFASTYSRPPVWPFFLVLALSTLVSGFLGYYNSWPAHQKVGRLRSVWALKGLFYGGRRRNGARYWVTIALRDLAQSEPSKRSSIAAFARAAIRRQLHARDNAAANEIWRLLQVVEAARPVWEYDLLEQVARSKIEAWSRGRALRRMADLRGLGALTVLISSLDDPDLAPHAARAIGSIGPAVASTDAVETLERLIRETANCLSASAATEAVIAIGRGHDAVLHESRHKLYPWQYFGVCLKQKHVGADELIERLFEAGVISADRRQGIAEESLERIRSEFDSRGAFEAMVEFLTATRSITNFDTESDRVPPDYFFLMEELRVIASPRFEIEDAVFENGQLSFRIFGEVRTIVPSFMGDWFDLSSVLGGINEAITAAGRTERFVTLFSGDQSAYVILGHKDGLDRLARELALPVEVNPDTSAAYGVAVERYAVEEISSQLGR